MRKLLTSILCFAIVLLFNSAWNSPESTINFGLLKYSGGGDWYANPTALPNLIEFCNERLGMDINEEPVTVEVGSPELFGLPFLHMTGHGNVVFSDEDARNLRTYLLAGGFLHIDDNYGMDKYVRPAMKKVFPEKEFVELPFSHGVYNQLYKFQNGLPKIHEHDGEAPKGFGILHEGRLLCFYSFESDLGDGWEDPEVHNDSPEVREKALRMGSNIVQYIFNQ